MLEQKFFLLFYFGQKEHYIADQVIALRKSEGVHAKAAFRRKVNPNALLTFASTSSLHNRVFESPWYIVCVISTIMSSLSRYGLKLNVTTVVIVIRDSLLELAKYIY